MDISCNSPRLALLAGMGVSSLLTASFATNDWTHKSGHYGKITMGLWKFCHTHLDGSTMCNSMDMDFSGEWPAVRVLMCAAMCAMAGALFFNLKESFSTTRQFERHAVTCYILSGVFTMAAVVAVLVQGSLRDNVSSSFWLAAASAPLTLAVGTAFLTKILHRHRRHQKVIKAMDGADSSDDGEDDSDNRCTGDSELVSLASVTTTRSLRCTDKE